MATKTDERKDFDRAKREVGKKYNLALAQAESQYQIGMKVAAKAYRAAMQARSACVAVAEPVYCEPEEGEGG